MSSEIGRIKLEEFMEELLDSQIIEEIEAKSKMMAKYPPLTWEVWSHLLRINYA